MTHGVPYQHPSVTFSHKHKSTHSRRTSTFHPVHAAAFWELREARCVKTNHRLSMWQCCCEKGGQWEDNNIYRLWARNLSGDSRMIICLMLLVVVVLHAVQCNEVQCKSVIFAFQPLLCMVPPNTVPASYVFSIAGFLFSGTNLLCGNLHLLQWLHLWQPLSLKPLWDATSLQPYELKGLIWLVKAWFFFHSVICDFLLRLWSQKNQVFKIIHHISN